jgi:hypothetical protein
VEHEGLLEAIGIRTRALLARQERTLAGCLEALAGAGIHLREPG